MPRILKYRGPTSLPVELDGITPEALAGKSRREIERLPIRHGNRALPLAELFRVAKKCGDGETLVLQGDLAGVHRIGARMTRGAIRVEGSAGRHVGSQMRGGKILVTGDAGDWLGGEMHSGRIRVRGNARDGVGGAYPGSRRGMTGGTILVAGAAGLEVGRLMRRGLIAIGGPVGPLAGANMLAGTILLAGECGPLPGAGMRRGTIALLKPGSRVDLLPSFRAGCRHRPVAMQLVLRELARRGFALSSDVFSALFDLFHGDLLEGGRGEVLMRAE